MLDAVLRKHKPGEEKNRQKEEERQEKKRRKLQHRAKAQEARVGKEKVQRAARLPSTIRPVPSLQDQLQRVYDVVCKARDGERLRAELFMQLPDKVEVPAIEYPAPLTALPDLPSGTESQLPANGILPIMAKLLPTEEVFGRWDCASQKAFWEQRRAFYNRLKMTELQRECRKRTLWPGGDLAIVKDRLLRSDVCRSLLLLPFELRTEEEVAEEEEDVGVVYFKLVERPIDLMAIREKIEKAQAYRSLAELEADMVLLFNNARKFDVYANEDPADRLVSVDANALQMLAKNTVKEVSDAVDKIQRSNKAIQKSPCERDPTSTDGGAAAHTVVPSKTTKSILAEGDFGTTASPPALNGFTCLFALTSTHLPLALLARNGILGF